MVLAVFTKSFCAQVILTIDLVRQTLWRLRFNAETEILLGCFSPMDFLCRAETHIVKGFQRHLGLSYIQYRLKS